MFSLCLSEGIDYDEAYSYRTAHDNTMMGIIRVVQADHDTDVPVGYMGLRLWSFLVGDGIIAYKMFASDHGVVAHAQKAHHFHMGRHRAGPGELGVAVHTCLLYTSGTSADYAPFEFMYKGEDGTMQYGGIDVSVGQYIAESMGKELKVENMSFDYLLPSLVKGDFDIVIAAMEADGDRLKSADFSDPYYTDLPPAILVKASDAASYKTLADFAGKSVACLLYTSVYLIEY